MSPATIMDRMKVLRKRVFGNVNSERYWSRRYARQRNSGTGSYGPLSEFKADVINGILQADDSIRSVIEFGCGDGNQLSLCRYPNYLGFDVGPAAVAMCRERFQSDPTRRFKLVRDYDGERADLSLSLDVIYHLVEHDVYESHLRMLFESSDRFVLIYSTNVEIEGDRTRHARHRVFSEWVDRNQPDWKLVRTIPNRHPDLSMAEFFLYEKTA